MADHYDQREVLHAVKTYDRAYQAAASVLRGTSADIGVGELDRIVLAVLASIKAEVDDRGKLTAAIEEALQELTYVYGDPRLISARRILKDALVS